MENNINTNMGQSPGMSQIPGNVKPSVGEIKGMFVKGGSTPLEWIQRNLESQGLKGTIPQVNPEQLTKEVEAKRSGVPLELPLTEPPKDVEILPELGFESKQLPESGVKDLSEKEGSISDKIADDIADVDEQVLDGKELNFKKLRESVKETKAQLKAKEDALKITEEKLKKYESGEVLPEVLIERQGEIERLSKFEKIVNLKGSVEYQEKYIKPISKLQEKLAEFAKDYDIPEEVMQDAMKFTGQADLNRFLSENFDSVGAIEVKGLFTEINQIKKEAEEAEKEPQTALEALQKESIQIRNKVMEEKRGKMAGTVRSSWRNALDKIKEEGKVKDLIHIDGDEAHNTNRVKPIISAASKEYGQLITMLADNGLEELPEPVADALSRLMLLAHASATSISERDSFAEQAGEIMANAKRTTSYVRPMVTGNFNGGSPAPTAPESLSPKDAGRMLAEAAIRARR